MPFPSRLGPSGRKAGCGCSENCRRPSDDPFHRFRRYVCCRHRVPGLASNGPIAQSGPPRAVGGPSRTGAIAYRGATDSYVSEAWRDARKHEVSAWTSPIASARSRSVVAIHPPVPIGAHSPSQAVSAANRQTPESSAAAARYSSTATIGDTKGAISGRSSNARAQTQVAINRPVGDARRVSPRQLLTFARLPPSQWLGARHRQSDELGPSLRRQST
jgi:hypothetical protein